MSDDTEVSIVPAPTTQAKSTAVSKREVLGSDKTPQDDWIDAHGFKYTVLGNGFELSASFDELPDEVMRGLAAFGGLTLAGNVTNTVRNGEIKGTPDEEQAALLAWIENLKAGNWTSPRGEIEAGVGLLAEAYVAAMAKAGTVLDLVATNTKLKAADKDKRKAVRSDPRVKLELNNILATRAAAKAASATGEIVSL